jgi:predicted PurR-regulated permease PerM
MARKAESKVRNKASLDAPDHRFWLPTGQILRTLLILVATAFGLYLCYRLALPFLPPLTWSIVLAVAFVPVHRRIEARFKNRNLAAGISVALAGLVVIVPLLFIAQQLIRELANGAVYVEELLRTSDWREAVSGYPRIADLIGWIEERLDPAGLVGGVAQWLTSQSRSLLAGSVAQVINAVLTFYLLFYFLRDRRRFLRGMIDLSPLNQREAQHVIGRFVETVHAIVFGTLVIGAIQGTLGGLMFWWLGLPTPVFWGAVMGLLAVVPVLGAFMVWVPAAVMLAINGEWLSATILTIWGAVIVASVDNLLFPILVGNRLRLHTVVAFVGILGGIIFLGASGLVLGPAIVAVTIALIEILRRRLDGLLLHEADDKA